MWRKAASFIFHLEQVFSTQEEKEKKKKNWQILKGNKSDVKERNQTREYKKIATFSWKNIIMIAAEILSKGERFTSKDSMGQFHQIKVQMP